MWGVLPEWMFLGMFGLLMFGGFILVMAGMVAKDRVSSSVGALAIATAISIVGFLVIVGLCRLGWKKLRKRD
jgi:hypothetical protein